ncbi:hypothetical protein ACFX10_029191 [Malus domestica]
MAIVLYLLGVGGATLPGVGTSSYRRSYSPSVSPRHRRRSYTPGLSPRPRRTSRRSYSPSVSPEPVKRRSRRRYSRSRDLADAGAQGLTGGVLPSGATRATSSRFMSRSASPRSTSPSS